MSIRLTRWRRPGLIAGRVDDPGAFALGVVSTGGRRHRLQAGPLLTRNCDGRQVTVTVEQVVRWLEGGANFIPIAIVERRMTAMVFQRGVMHRAGAPE